MEKHQVAAAVTGLGFFHRGGAEARRMNKSLSNPGLKEYWIFYRGDADARRANNQVNLFLHFSRSHLLRNQIKIRELSKKGPRKTEALII